MFIYQRINLGMRWSINPAAVDQGHRFFHREKVSNWKVCPSMDICTKPVFNEVCVLSWSHHFVLEINWFLTYSLLKDWVRLLWRINECQVQISIQRESPFPGFHAQSQEKIEYACGGFKENPHHHVLSGWWSGNPGLIQRFGGRNLLLYLIGKV